MFHQYFQDPLDYSFMFLFHLHKDQNVIHYSLEGSGTVGHFEEHYKKFEEAAVSTEDHFPFISRLNVYIIEAPANIQFREVPSSTELGDEFGDERKGISVLDGYGIQYMIVLDQLEQAIFLLNEEHRGCYGGFGGLNSSSMQVFLQEGI